MKDYISIGKFVAVHGLKGVLVLKHALGKQTALHGLKALFVEDGGGYVPWFIEHAKGKSVTEVLIKLEDINSPEAAKKLSQKTIWLTREDFDKQASKSAAITYIGYMVINYGAPVGNIIEVIEQPHQVLCSVSINGKEAYIPLHSETLKNVDRERREIHVELPEGLLEIYLED